MSEIKVDTLTGKTTANDITVTVGASATQSLEQGLVKVWVNFNGTGTIAVNDSNNVASLTDDSTGAHRVNPTSVFSTANHSSVGSNINDSTTSNRATVTVAAGTLGSTTGQIAFRVYSDSLGNYLDCTDVNIHTLGDLA